MECESKAIRVCRFLNDISGPRSPDFRSPKSLLRPRDYKRLLSNGLTVADELALLKILSKQEIADRTASGELKLTSPMIPVLEDPQKALSSTYRHGEERELRNIILSSLYLSSFEVPARLVYKPFTYENESELMVLSNCIWKYLMATSTNPFKLAI
jgi:hypothetical protein